VEAVAREEARLGGVQDETELAPAASRSSVQWLHAKREPTMSGRVGHRKRLMCVNAANLRANHLYLTGHTDFFPADCFGASSQADGTGKALRLDVAGLSAPVYTDIPTDAKSGKPRLFFRKRGWVREFFAKHGIKPGDIVAIERVSSHRFRILPFEAKEERQHPAVFSFDHEPEGDGPRVIELFAHAVAAGCRAA